MCLNTVDFALEWDNIEKSYIGIGYKTYDSLNTNFNGIELKLGKWVNFDPDPSISYQGLLVIEHRPAEFAGDENLYIPGFHIFLKPNDAIDYGGSYLYEVMYKNVLAYGTNNTIFKDDQYLNGPCVIAADMKVVRKLNKKQAKNGL